MAATVALDASDAASRGRSEGDACGLGSRLQHAERVYFDVSKNVGNDAGFVFQSNEGSRRTQCEKCLIEIILVALEWIWLLAACGRHRRGFCVIEDEHEDAAVGTKSAAGGGAGFGERIGRGDVFAGDDETCA